ncbi:MAG: isovaleryl-CoA dehydrogenase [Alphaproteobacteria bacterium]|nr:MAG: isovaleryl-CoA dehydrogenase [Alphaproteobacteria bacterium]
MVSPAPITRLPTHEVTNQPPPLPAYNLFERDLVLREALAREGGAWATDTVAALGAVMGRPETLELANQANRHKPELRAFNRYGQRIDEVEFHPAYHALMEIAIGHEISAIAWTADQPGHVVHTALEYLFAQIEGGVCCPVTMTYAAVPVLQKSSELKTDWLTKVTSATYDPAVAPVSEKKGATIGMAMTEKQGGSDVRTNTTAASPLDAGWYALTGHKWFCSAPMSDGFLTLAQAPGGLSCFFVPRWRPDGTRNPFFIQRLKDKLGNWSNASSEIEYHDTWGLLVGEEGRGIATIMTMVHHTRLDTAMAPAALMRQALVQAIHHVRHRTAFQKKLIDQPLMRRVLADMALDSAAATMLLMRVARGYDEAASSSDGAGYARLAVAVAKYWLNKQAPNFVYEAMECFGGVGYVEETIMPRLYREAPLNSIWEGSGNVICLDVLRAINRDPGALDAVLGDLAAATGADRTFDTALTRFQNAVADTSDPEGRARSLTEQLALLLQASLMIRHAPPALADAFVATRLGGEHGRTFGTIPASVDCDSILGHAWPE